MRVDLGATAAVPAAADKKLVDGAREFEAMLLGQMLKGLAFGGAPGEDADDSEAGAAGTVREFRHGGRGEGGCGGRRVRAGAADRSAGWGPARCHQRGGFRKSGRY